MTTRPTAAVPGRDHILIVGPSKSGTTGLFNAVKHSLAAAGHDYTTIFEPHSPGQFDRHFLYAPDRPVLTKSTIDRMHQVVGDPAAFDKRLTTVRDPRDILISSLLFRPLTRRALEAASDDGSRALLDAVRRKESEPSSVSVRSLFDLSRERGLGARPYRALREALTVQQALIDRSGFHVVRYEKFVDDDLADVEQYLGLPLGVSDESSSTYGHISRSRTTGAFRQWFRADDLAFYNQLFGPHIEALGYPLDVDLDAEPILDPAIGSDYLETRMVRRRAVLRRLTAGRDTPETAVIGGPEELEETIDHARDGDARACVRLAHSYLRGDLAEPDLVAALGWARRAARVGLADGVQLVLRVIDELDPDDAALRREQRAWSVVVADRARVRTVERALSRERSATSRPIGRRVLAALRRALRAARQRRAAR